MIQKETASQAEYEAEEGEDGDDEIEYDVFYTSERIKETLT
jgi:hypothetical protein